MFWAISSLVEAIVMPVIVLMFRLLFRVIPGHRGYTLANLLPVSADIALQVMKSPMADGIIPGITRQHFSQEHQTPRRVYREYRPR